MLATANMRRDNYRIVKPNQVRALLREYVSFRMRAMVAEGERGTSSRIAGTLGISTAHVTNVTKNERGISDDIVDRFIDAYDLDREKLLEEALAWKSSLPISEPPPLQVREEVARYGSELDLVTELIVRKGEATAQEVRDAFSAAGHAARKATEGLGTEETVREVMSWIRKLRRGDFHAGTAVDAAEVAAEEAETRDAFNPRGKE